MIIARRWRHDGEFSSVLFVGPNPIAEISPNRGKPGFRCSVNYNGLETTRFADRESAMAYAEQTLDARVRRLLTKAAQDALAAAGL